MIRVLDAYLARRRLKRLREAQDIAYAAYRQAKGAYDDADARRDSRDKGSTMERLKLAMNAALSADVARGRVEREMAR